MAHTWQVYDTESGRVVSTIKRVAASVTLTAGAANNGSAAVTVASTSGLFPGMVLVGKGIPTGTTVLTVDSAATFTMSSAATAAIAGAVIHARSYIPYKADGTIDVREVHLEHYRDLFADMSDVGLEAVVLNEDEVPVSFRNRRMMRAAFLPGDLVIKGGETGLADLPWAVGATTFCDVFTPNPTFTTSDDVAHRAPREQTQKCSFVHFILEDGTLVPVLRKPSYDIVPVS